MHHPWQGVVKYFVLSLLQHGLLQKKLSVHLFSLNRRNYLMVYPAHRINIADQLWYMFYLLHKKAFRNLCPF